MGIVDQVPTKGTLRRIFKQVVFGGRLRCPQCGGRRVVSLKPEERWRCRDCRLPFSIKSASWLKGSKLSLEVLWLLVWCWQKEVPVKQTAAITGVSRPTVFLWFKKFRDHVPKERLSVMLKGAVACDEMFTKKRAVMGVKQKGTRNLALWVLNEKDPNKRHAIEFLSQYVQPGSSLCTDGGGIYRGISKQLNVVHSYEVHRKWEFSLTAEIEGIWGCFRTFIRRMYHHVTSEYLPDLAAEFTLRFRRDEVFESPRNYLAICLHSDPFAL